MLEDSELVTLLGRVAMGDRVSFRTLYDAMSPKLYGLSLRLLKRPDLADEVMQDAFVSIWHNAREYHVERGSAGGWMLTIARYRALDALRRRRFEIYTDDDSLIALAEAHVADEPVQDETSFLALQGCLDQITEQQRESLLRAYYEGMSHEELARHMATPLA